MCTCPSRKNPIPQPLMLSRALSANTRQVVLGRVVLARRHGKEFTHGLTPPQRLNIYDFMNSLAIFNSS